MGANIGNQGGSLSEINVTPLVDVMLVLLIIFMVTAPMMQQGLEVDLPKAEAKAIDSLADELVVTVVRDGSVYLGDTAATVENIGEIVKNAIADRERKEVYLRADKRVEYGHVVKIMANIRNSGVEGLGIITEEESIPIRKEKGGK